MLWRSEPLVTIALRLHGIQVIIDDRGGTLRFRRRWEGITDSDRLPRRARDLQ